MEKEVRGRESSYLTSSRASQICIEKHSPGILSNVGIA